MVYTSRNQTRETEGQGYLPEFGRQGVAKALRFVIQAISKYFMLYSEITGFSIFLGGRLQDLQGTLNSDQDMLPSIKLLPRQQQCCSSQGFLGTYTLR